MPNLLETKYPPFADRIQELATNFRLPTVAEQAEPGRTFKTPLDFDADGVAEWELTVSGRQGRR